MSLKAFHVLFILVATFTCAGFGVWAVMQGTETGGATAAMGVASLLGALALPIYGVWFLKKTKDVSYL